MMNRVVERKLQIRDGRILKQAPEVDDLYQLLARQPRETVEIGLERLAIPGGHVRRGTDGIRPSAALIVKLTRGDRIHKEVLRRGYVPGQFQRSFRDSVGAIIALFRGNGLNDLTRDTMLVLERGQGHLQ
jgi:hypothetical protein